MQVRHFTVWHMLRVSMAIGWSDFQLKYRWSVLGYLWSFAAPVAKFIVILHVFRPLTQGISYYPFYLFLGIILWEHFMLTTNACISSLKSQEPLLKKIPFPRSIVALAAIWTNLIVLTTYLLVFFVAMLFFGVPLHPAIVIYVPLLLIQAGLLAGGVGMFVSAFSLRFRDVPHLWPIVLQVLFWLTPIVYRFQPNVPVTQDIQKMFNQGVADHSVFTLLDMFIRFQPLSLIMHAARRVLLYPDILGYPSFMHVLGILGVSALVFLIGFGIFSLRSQHFLDEF